LTSIETLIGVIATKTGLTFDSLLDILLEEQGIEYFIYYSVTTIGWFSIDAWLIGKATSVLFSKLLLIFVTVFSGIGITRLYYMELTR